MKTNFLSITLLIFLVAACGGRKDHIHSSGEKPRFLPGHILTKGKFSDLHKAKDYLDYDNDHIQDDLDSDIDNDGVTNYLDQYPFDETKQSRDEDGDGIPDFIDFHVGVNQKENQNFERNWIQEILFKKTGIVLAENKNRFSLKELRTIYEYFITGPINNWKFQNLVIIIRDDIENGYIADYYSYWKSISIHEVDYLKEGTNFRETLTHESFHAVAIDAPMVYSAFLDLSGWMPGTEDGKVGYYFQGDNKIKEFIPFSDFRYNFDYVKEIVQSDQFPSDYSKAGPEEMFAECGTATFLIDQPRSNYNRQRYYNLFHFKETEAYRFFHNIFNR